MRRTVKLLLYYCCLEFFIQVGAEACSQNPNDILYSPSFRLDYLEQCYISDYLITTSETSMANAILPKSLRILCFGDSLTAGYTSYGYGHYPYADHLRVRLQYLLSTADIDVEVAGQSGDLVQGPLGQYLSRIKAKCPVDEERQYDWIVIMGGTNDLGWGHQPKEIYEGLKLVWDVALDTGANVLALNVLESAASSEQMINKRDALNTMIKEHQQERFYTFDLYSKIPYASLDEAERDKLWDDGLHLTAEGYKVMGEVIAAGLFEILQQDAENMAPASQGTNRS